MKPFNFSVVLDANTPKEIVSFAPGSIHFMNIQFSAAGYLGTGTGGYPVSANDTLEILYSDFHKDELLDTVRIDGFSVAGATVYVYGFMR